MCIKTMHNYAHVLPKQHLSKISIMIIEKFVGVFMLHCE